MARAVRHTWELYGGPKQTEVQLVLLNEKEHSRLHAKFLQDPTATDVMAFCYRDDDLYGEILVNVDMAARQAKCHDRGPLDELLLYLVHGALHLLGFDDLDAAARAQMRAAERRVMEQLKLHLSA